VISAALELARLGLHVFPVVSGGKRPAVRGWQTLASPEPDDIARLFASGSFNLGVATGAPSGVWILDVDVKGGVNGLGTLATLEHRHGPLPATWRASTPSGGLHIWFSLPPGRRIGNRVGCATGLDIRGEGGFIVAPPSKACGGAYRWIAGSRDDRPAQAPCWLLDLAAPTAPPPAHRTPPPLRSATVGRYAAAAVRGEIERVRSAKPGSRNLTLFQASANLGELVGAAAIDRQAVEAALIDAATSCGLIADDGAHPVHATIKSGMERGIGHPRVIPL
jgi:hypothetical protein